MDGSNTPDQFTPTVADVIGSIIHAGKNLSAHLSQVQIGADWAEIIKHIDHMRTMASLVKSAVDNAAEAPAE